MEQTPCGRGQTTTFLDALRAEGFIAPLSVDGAINGPLFRGGVEQHLALTLRPGDIVVMENLWDLCGRILDEFTEHECRNDFKHCGD